MLKNLDGNSPDTNIHLLLISESLIPALLRKPFGIPNVLVLQSGYMAVSTVPSLMVKGNSRTGFSKMEAPFGCRPIPLYPQVIKTFLLNQLLFLFRDA